MVKIEIIDDTVNDTSQSIHGDHSNRRRQACQGSTMSTSTSLSLPMDLSQMDSSIVSIARYCAASIIQSVARGVIVRNTRQRSLRRESKSFTMKVSHDSHPSLSIFIRDMVRFKFACRVVQRTWRSYWIYVQDRRCIEKPNNQPAEGEIIDNVYLDQKKVLYSNKSPSFSSLPQPPPPTNFKVLPEKKRMDGRESLTSKTRDDTIPKNREEAVRKAYDMCKPSMNGVCLGAHQVLNILKAVDILEEGVHHSLTRHFLVDQNINGANTRMGCEGNRRRSRCSHENTRFFLRLSNTADFEKDLIDAGREMCASSGKNNAVSRIRFHHFSDSNGAREGIIKLVDVPNECLQYLIRHHGVKSYSDAMVFEVISLLGVKSGQSSNSGSNCNHPEAAKGGIVEHLQFILHMVESPWDRARIETMSEIVRFIDEWERKIHESEASIPNTNDGSPAGNKEEIILQLEQANTRISSLVDEVDMLRAQMTRLVEREKLGQKGVEISPPTAIKEVEMKAEAKTSSLPIPPRKMESRRRSMPMKSRTDQFQSSQKKTPKNNAQQKSRGHKAIPVRRGETRKAATPITPAYTFAASKARTNINMNAYANSLKSHKVSVVDIKFGKNAMREARPNTAPASATRKKPGPKSMRPRSRGKPTTDGGRDTMTYTSYPTTKPKNTSSSRSRSATSSFDDISLASTLKKSREKRKHSRRVGWRDDDGDNDMYIPGTSNNNSEAKEGNDIVEARTIAEEKNHTQFRPTSKHHHHHTGSSDSVASTTSTTTSSKRIDSPSERLNKILERINFDNFNKP